MHRRRHRLDGQPRIRSLIALAPEGPAMPQLDSLEPRRGLVLSFASCHGHSRCCFVVVVVVLAKKQVLYPVRRAPTQKERGASRNAFPLSRTRSSKNTQSSGRAFPLAYMHRTVAARPSSLWVLTTAQRSSTRLPQIQPRKSKKGNRFVFRPGTCPSSKI